MPGYKAGGPIQSSLNVAMALKNDYRVFVLTTDTDHGETEPYKGVPSNEWVNNIDPAISVYYAKKTTLSLKQLKQEIDSVNPDFIYLNHMFSPKFVLYPLWLKFLGQIKTKVIVCPRGALYDSALAIKPYKKYPFLKLFRLINIHKRITFHATNQREKLAIERFFPGSSILIADNLPKMQQDVWTSCVKKQGSISCISIARIHPIKNLLYFLKSLQSITANVKLSIVGPVEDATYWNDCLSFIKTLPSNIEITYLGSIENNLLGKIIQEHHLFVLPTTGENFGHSIFEALLSGRPVLISDQTPWLDLAAKKIGWDLSLDDPKQFTDVVAQTAQWDQMTFDDWSKSTWQYASTFISNPSLYKSYLDLFS